MTYSLLNLFGWVGNFISSFLQIEDSANSADAESMLKEFKKYQFIELSEQLLSSSIITTDNNVFNEFINERITSTKCEAIALQGITSDVDDDIPIYIALIVIDAFKHLNIVTTTENLDYYKQFIINWFISAIKFPHRL